MARTTIRVLDFQSLRRIVISYITMKLSTNNKINCVSLSKHRHSRYPFGAKLLRMITVPKSYDNNVQFLEKRKGKAGNIHST